RSPASRNCRSNSSGEANAVYEYPHRQGPGGITQREDRLMKTAIKTLAVMSAMFMASTSTSFAFEEGKLLIWINGDKGFNGLQAVGDKFKADLGIDVVVEHPESVTEKFQQSAATG